MSKGKSKKDKKRRDVRQALNKRLRQKVKKKFPDQKVIANYSQDGVKMSEVLEQFIEPYAILAHSKNAYRKLLSIAIIAWNETLLPEKSGVSDFDHIFAMLSEEDREDMRNIIVEMIDRKERHFSQYRRIILDFEIADAGDNWHLSVISTPDPV